jgi:transcriptional regulator with XRE-family HTH domain
MAKGSRGGKVERPSEAFVRNMILTRRQKLDENGRPWSQKRLAAELKRIGSPLDEAAIAKLETDRRRLTLDDALEIAAALDVSPAYLFTPQEEGSEVKIAPRKKQTAQEVREWVRGEGPLTDTDAARRFYESQMPKEERAALSSTLEGMKRGNAEIARELDEMKRLLKTITKKGRG